MPVQFEDDFSGARQHVSLGLGGGEGETSAVYC